VSEVLDRIVRTREEALELKRVKARAHYAANRELIKQRERDRYAANRDKIKAQAAAYRAANPDKIAAASRAYDEAHRDERKAYAAAWRERNREKARATTAAYRKAHPDRVKRAIEDWHARHPEVRRAHRADRLAARRAALGKVSKDIVPRLMTLQRALCSGCRADLRATGFHLDHIAPLAKGGEHADGNLQLLCPPCNLNKSDKDPIAWAQERGRLL
jgi:5-methylcytosine-specific restriction endonuclease McrA